MTPKPREQGEKEEEEADDRQLNCFFFSSLTDTTVRTAFILYGSNRSFEYT